MKKFYFFRRDRARPCPQCKNSVFGPRQKGRGKRSQAPPLRILISFVILNILFCQQLWAEDSLRVHFIDVGFGDAILIVLPNEKAVMVDAGEARYGKKLTAHLKGQGIHEIDTAVLTHPHKNHFGGFVELLESFPIKNFYYNGDERAVDEGYDQFLAQVKNKMGAVPRRLKRGDVLQRGGDLNWEVLSPGDFLGSTNEESLVSILTYRETNIVFTADAEPARLNPLIAKYPKIAQADVLQIPHHGLEIEQIVHHKLHNKFLVVSVKENDVSRQALEYLYGLDKNELTTAREGDIVLESDGKAFRVVTKQK